MFCLYAHVNIYWLQVQWSLTTIRHLQQNQETREGRSSPQAFWEIQRVWSIKENKTFSYKLDKILCKPLYFVCLFACCVQVESAPNPLATEELNFLAKLMGGMEVQKLSNADAAFKVNLLALEQEDEGM